MQRTDSSWKSKSHHNYHELVLRCVRAFENYFTCKFGLYICLVRSNHSNSNRLENVIPTQVSHNSSSVSMASQVHGQKATRTAFAISGW